MITISVNQHIEMAKSVNSTDPCSKLRHKKTSNNSPNHLNIPACDQSRSAIIDVIILIAVIIAIGFLLYPYAKIISHKSIELTQEVADMVFDEITRSPMVFGCLGLSIFFAVMALVAITVYMDRRCGKEGCRGFRNAAEFDIQLETEGSVKKSNHLQDRTALRKGLFELPRDHHKELEAELKKMAPPNGRAVLVFRARCGCSVGRMEVPGPRKFRKVKK